MTNSSQSTGLVALADRLELWPIDRLRPYDRKATQELMADTLTSLLPNVVALCQRSLS